VSNFPPHTGRTPAEIAFPLIVFEVEEELRRRFPGDATAAACVEILRAKCEAVTGRKFYSATVAEELRSLRAANEQLETDNVALRCERAGLIPTAGGEA
jgi:hypothetical protein